MGGALPLKYSEYFGAKGHKSFKVKVFWRQRARVILRMKISGVIVVIVTKDLLSSFCCQFYKKNLPLSPMVQRNKLECSSPAKTKCSGLAALEVLD